MNARLIYGEKYIYADGAVREMGLWQLPGRSTDWPHGLKYRLFYGLVDGTCLVHYDNKRGKGEHRHVRNEATPYRFKNVESLVADFLSDIEYVRSAED